MMLLLLMVLAVAAQDPGESQRTLCGRVLARAHSLYCYGLDPVPEEPMDSTLAKFSNLDSNLIGGPKIPSRFTHKLRRAAARSEVDSSLIEMCCLRPCHINELLKNC